MPWGLHDQRIFALGFNFVFNFNQLITFLCQVDAAIEVYREYSRIPTIGNAYVNNSETAGHIRVSSEWSTRDIERSTKVKFIRHHIAQLNDVFPSFPSDISTEYVYYAVVVALKCTPPPSLQWFMSCQKDIEVTAH